jgi:hypothetical protein
MQQILTAVEKQISNHRQLVGGVLLVVALIALQYTTRISYLLFHSLAEIFSIVIAFSLFLIVWNSREIIRNQYLLFIGIAYLFIGFLDLLHTLSYKGMPIFTDYDYYANQLWIGARYLESITLLAAFSFLTQNRRVLPAVTFFSYGAITGLLIASIFSWKVFPECFIEGTGLTSFKKNSEYVICILLVLSSSLLVVNRHRFERGIYQLLLASMFCTIISELAFTYYIDNYGLSNLVGHYFKIFSFYLVYRAIIQTGIKQPYQLIFRELQTSNSHLRAEIRIRKETEEHLQAALRDVKTLSGIIPICSTCKQIRNDQGFWQQVEAFINDHSDAQFTHGICPECYQKAMVELDEE